MEGSVCVHCVSGLLSCLLGNLHLNVVGEGHSTELLGLLEPFVFDWTGIHV